MSVKLSNYAYEPPKANPSQLAAASVASVASGVVAFVISLTKYFYWSPTSTATPDNITVICPTSITPPAPGRWLVYNAGEDFTVEEIATDTVTLTAGHVGKYLVLTSDGDASGIVSIVIDIDIAPVGAGFVIDYRGSGYCDINTTPIPGVILYGARQIVNGNVLAIKEIADNEWQISNAYQDQQYEYVAAYSDDDTFTIGDVVFAQGQQMAVGTTQFPTIEKMTNINTQSPFGVIAGSVGAKEATLVLKRGYISYDFGESVTPGSQVYISTSTFKITTTPAGNSIGVVLSNVFGTVYNVYINVNQPPLYLTTSAVQPGDLAYGQRGNVLHKFTIDRAANCGVSDLAQSNLLSWNPVPTPSAGDIIIFDADNGAKSAGMSVDSFYNFENFYYKNIVSVATTSALNATYNNGTDGVGATLTSNVNGAIVVDSNTLSVGDRVLAKSQSPTYENGIYTVTDAGSVSTPYILTRAVDYDTPEEIHLNDLVPVGQGVVNGNLIFQQSGTVTEIGTDAILFSNFTRNASTKAVSDTTQSSVLSLDSSPTPVNGNIITFQVSGGNFAAVDSGININSISTLENFHYENMTRVATTASLDATYDNGTDGVGATLTSNVDGAIVIDTITLSVNDRVLVKNQSTAYQNGIYIVTDTGDVSNPYVLTRSVDYDTPAQIHLNDFVPVAQGLVNGQLIFRQSATVTTIGVDSISFADFTRNASTKVVSDSSQGAVLSLDTFPVAPVDENLIMFQVFGGQVAAKDSGININNIPSGGSGGFLGVLTKTGATYTLQASDLGYILLFTNATLPVQLTIPEDLATEPKGFGLLLPGANALKLIPGTGVVINGQLTITNNNLVLVNLYADNTWQVNDARDENAIQKYVLGVSTSETFAFGDVVKVNGINSSGLPSITKFNNVQTDIPLGVYLINDLETSTVNLILERGLMDNETGDSTPNTPLYIQNSGTIALNQTNRPCGYIINADYIYININAAISPIGTAAFASLTDTTTPVVSSLASFTASNLPAFSLDGSLVDSTIPVSQVVTKTTESVLTLFQLFSPLTNAALFNPTSTFSNGAVYPAFVFPAGVDSELFGQCALPDNYSLDNTFNIQLFWFAQSGTAAQTTRLKIDAFIINANSTMNKNFGTAVNVDDSFSAVDTLEDTGYSADVTPGGDSPSTQSLLCVRIRRTAADGGTLSGAIQLTDMKFKHASS